MDEKMTIIYRGGFVPDLAILFDSDSEFDGWLFAKHPDGEWVSLCKILPV